MSARPARPTRPDRRGRTARAVGLALVLGMALVAAAWGDDDGGDGSGTPTLDAAAEEGRQVAQDNGCVSCHSADGDDGTGPSWQGMWGSTVELDGGGTVVADRAYLERSLQDPRAEVVEGYGPLMPTFDLSPTEIDALAAYLEALA